MARDFARWPRCCCRGLSALLADGRISLRNVGLCRHLLARYRQSARGPRSFWPRLISGKSICLASWKALTKPAGCGLTWQRNSVWAPAWWLPAAPATTQRLPAAWARSVEGNAFVSLGTSGVCLRQWLYLPKPGKRRACLLPRASQLPGTDGRDPVGHRCAQRYSNESAANRTGDLTAELGDTLQAPSGVTFLPYLSGERTPHNDAEFRGAFIGLGHESSRAVLTRPCWRAFSFAIRDSLEALKSAGSSLSRVTAIGGGSRSRYWLASIATTLGIPVDIPADGDFGAAFGASPARPDRRDRCRSGLGLLRAADGSQHRTGLRLRDGYEAAYLRYRASIRRSRLCKKDGSLVAR